MPRPMWSGSISFGLVNVPVKLYNTVKKKTLDFHQLRKKDGCRIRLKKVCQSDGEEVPNEQIVKGYEVSPERYVVVSQEELESLYPKAIKAIEIEDFVEFNQIDPLLYEQSYYLVPDKGASKAYSLLATAMKKTNKVAIARFVLRNKQHLAAIRPNKNALVVSTMFFTDEIIRQDQLEDLPDETIEPTERELAMAEQLIEALSGDFDHSKYRDEYREKVAEMIERKAEGQEVVSEPAAKAGPKVVDLMAALEASLAAMKSQKKTPVKERKKKVRAH